MAEGKFDVYQDKANKWRWKLVGSNGRTIASSGESFASRANAARAAGNVKRRAAKAAPPPRGTAGRGGSSGSKRKPAKSATRKGPMRGR